MTRARLLVGVTASATVTAGVLLLTPVSAVGLPDPLVPIVVAGGVTSDSGSPALTWTQTAAITIVEVADLDVAFGESLHVDQSPGDVLVIRITDAATEAVIAGSITADAGLYILRSSANGIVVDASGTISTGGPLIISTGDATNVDLASPAQIDSALSGAADVVVAGTATAGGGILALHGRKVIVPGSVRGEADAPVAFTLAGSTTIGVDPFALIPNDPPLAGGEHVISGTVTSASGTIAIVGGPQTISGQVRAAPGAVTLLGGSSERATIVASSGQLLATGVPGPAGDATGGWLTDSTSPVTIQVATLAIGGFPSGPAHSRAFFSVQQLDVSGGQFESTLVSASCDAVADPGAFTTTLMISDFSSPATPDILAGFDPGIPNQPPIDLVPAGRVFVNEQSTSTVAGFEVLTMTALRFETPAGDFSIGKAACARALPTASGPGAAAPTGALPPTGSQGGTASAAAAFAVLALLAGCLVRRVRPGRSRV